MIEAKISTRTRYLIMTEADAAAFSCALKEMFPEAVFAEGWSHNTDSLAVAASLPECKDRMPYIFFPPPGWEPVLELYRPKHGPPTGNYRGQTGRENMLEYLKSRWDWSLPLGAKWAWDPPTLLHGRITTSYQRDDVETKRFLGRVKIEYPHLGIVMGEKTTGTWAGHDALRWCSRGRIWRFPELPWYRDEDQLRFPSPDEPADTAPPMAT